MIYHAHIREHEKRDGRFVTSMAGLVVVSSDPEHDLCHALTEAGLADGPIQFWRDGVRTLHHPSIHRMGRMRIELGGKFPYRRVRRDEGQAAANLRADGSAPIPDGQTEAGRCGGSQDNADASPDARRA